MSGFLIRLLIANVVICLCVTVGKRWPGLAGLIAVMPLASLIVLVWLYHDLSANADARVSGTRQLTEFTRAALVGMLPTVGFYLAVDTALRRQFGFAAAVALGLLVWAIGAGCHQRWLAD